MRFFNEEWIKAMKTGKYICSKCGGLMEFESEWEDVLICTVCNHDIAFERYGFENDEDYEALFPTYEQVMGICNEEECSDGCDDYDNDDEYR